MFMCNNYVFMSLVETLHATLDSSLTRLRLYFACPDVDKLTNTWVQLKSKVVP